MTENNEGKKQKGKMQVKIQADTCRRVPKVQNNFKSIRDVHESFETMLHQCLTKARRQVELEHNKRREQLEKFARTTVIATTLDASKGINRPKMIDASTMACNESMVEERPLLPAISAFPISTESLSNNDHNTQVKVNKDALAQCEPVVLSVKVVEQRHRDNNFWDQPNSYRMICSEVHKANLMRRHRLHHNHPRVGKSRNREANGQLIILRGVRFGNLTPIPTVPELDPYGYECFNCRRMGHNAKDCTEVYREHCENCGRLDTQIHKCPRCSVAYWRDGFYQEEDPDYFEYIAIRNPLTVPAIQPPISPAPDGSTEVEVETSDQLEGNLLLASGSLMASHNILQLAESPLDF